MNSRSPKIPAKRPSDFDGGQRGKTIVEHLAGGGADQLVRRKRLDLSDDCLDNRVGHGLPLYQARNGASRNQWRCITDTSVTGIPTLRKATKPIGRPARSVSPAAATLAAAAMIVALPPKQAPSESAHQ